MKSIKIGLLAERKSPPDYRVAFIPEQCNHLLASYPQLNVVVEKSPTRAIPDHEYEAEGIDVLDHINDCDIVFGVKEVPKEQLIAGMTYCFFTHTIKKQNHNKAMLKRMMELGNTVYDYELITDDKGTRTVAFGYYAGLVGAYNGLRGWGEKYGHYSLQPAHECGHFALLKRQIKDLGKLPAIKIVIAGRGRVGKGAKEMLDTFGIRQVDQQAFLEKSFEEPVYTMLQSGDYYALPNDQQWDSAYFHANPDAVTSTFWRFAQVTDLLITTAFWHPSTPPLFTVEQANDPAFKIKLIADVTCDVEGFIPITLRSSTIARPFYDYVKGQHKEADAFSSLDHITIMAVDNLPCELPRDASCEFGRQLLDNFVPYLLEGNHPVAERAKILDKGQLTPRYQYLAEWVNS